MEGLQTTGRDVEGERVHRPRSRGRRCGAARGPALGALLGALGLAAAAMPAGATTLFDLDLGLETTSCNAAPSELSSCVKAAGSSGLYGTPQTVRIGFDFAGASGGVVPIEIRGLTFPDTAGSFGESVSFSLPETLTGTWDSGSAASTVELDPFELTLSGALNDTEQFSMTTGSVPARTGCDLHVSMSGIGLTGDPRDGPAELGLVGSACVDELTLPDSPESGQEELFAIVSGTTTGTAVPEPGTMALLGVGLFSLGASGGSARRRAARAAGRPADPRRM